MYAKLFSRITESSLMEEQVNVRYVFMMLLAISDPEGTVVGTDIAIARRLNIPLVEFKRCVEQLGRPDLESNSQKAEGRRVIPSAGERGYEIVNYTTYRGLRDEEDRREYMREYMRNRRAQKTDNKDVASVNSRKQRKSQLAHTSASVSAKEGSSEGNQFEKLPDELDRQDFKGKWVEYLEFRREKRYTRLGTISILEKWSEMAKWGSDAAIQSLREAISNGWQGTFYPKSNGFKKSEPEKQKLPPPPEPPEWVKEKRRQQESERNG